jgi:uncharacterized membrane protein
MNVEQASVRSDRTLVIFAYVMHLLGAGTGITSIVGLIVNYLRRDRVGVWDTHHRWMIRSFWWALLWVIVGVGTISLYIGYFILSFVWLWYGYRSVRGLFALVDGSSMPPAGLSGLARLLGERR